MANRYLAIKLQTPSFCTLLKTSLNIHKKILAFGGFAILRLCHTYSSRGSQDQYALLLWLRVVVGQVMSSLLITLIICLKSRKSVGLLFLISSVLSLRLCLSFAWSGPLITVIKSVKDHKYIERVFSQFPLSLFRRIPPDILL